MQNGIKMPRFLITSSASHGSSHPHPCAPKQSKNSRKAVVKQSKNSRRLWKPLEKRSKSAPARGRCRQPPESSCQRFHSTGRCTAPGSIQTIKPFFDRKSSHSFDWDRTAQVLRQSSSISSYSKFVMFNTKSIILNNKIHHFKQQNSSFSINIHHC